MVRVVRVVGAEGTGADALAEALRGHLPVTDWRVVTGLEPEVPDARGPADAPDLVLLMGLDSAAASTAERDQDAALRALLARGHPTYAVIYGQGPQRLRNAMRVLFPQDGPAPRWHGTCENCADPDCEFRLFTALKGLKAAGPGPA